MTGTGWVLARMDRRAIGQQLGDGGESGRSRSESAVRRNGATRLSAGVGRDGVPGW